ncbi:putative Polysaccharide lyase family 4, domain III-domain-containing protein [Seiridium cardinale]|uniref:rhamnogalacturonan endolyase n=1 Tax=Seiridium cardinale TaxID=138064 RepID=A0ABR2X7R9_9PEZI
MRVTSLLTCLSSVSVALATPFLDQIDNSTWVFGNDLFNVTQESVYATKVYYKGYELVGSAAGHYMGYDGENNFAWTSASIAAQGDDYIDISFTTTTGELHWVVFDGLAGSYQYFVNTGVPDLSILRTLWRLDPTLFLNARTYLRDQALPDFSLYANATKVQDETWDLEDGTYITKYDFSDFVRDRDYYGVYGPGTVGSWYIFPGGDYHNSNQLSQTLTVHRESSTGDSVQLNVFQDTSHFRVGQTTPQPVGKIWGPWLWYLNDGDLDDVENQRQTELQNWPYSWLDDAAYQSRGELSGALKLSDGRAASGAAVYLGDTDTTVRPLVQGSNYYYTTYTDADGKFSFSDVRSGDYGLYAWSSGGDIADVYTNFTSSGVAISNGKTTDLGTLSWEVPGLESIFQIGDFDKKALGFKNGGPPYQHGVADESPANLTYTIGASDVSEWYYAQSLVGTWTVEFSLTAAEIASHTSGAQLSVSLAGYSQSATLNISVNGDFLASLSKDNLASDPALYRSGKTSGEWRFFQYEIDANVLGEGVNTVDFTITQYTQWRGFLWDSVILEWL